MDRRTKQRIDLRLLGRLAEDEVLGSPLEGTTENISRGGILMRWNEGVVLPEIGAGLTVEFPLPESAEFGPRVMRCRTKVIRIEEAADGRKSVAMRIEGINIMPVAAPAITEVDLHTLRPVSERVN